MNATKPRRDNLWDYVDHRIEVEGYYETSNVLNTNGRPNKTVLIQEGMAFVDGKEIPIGHAWVQSASNIVNLKPLRGQKIRFTAVVNQYTKSLQVPNESGMMSELRCGLIRPEDAEIVGGYGDEKGGDYNAIPTPTPRYEIPEVKPEVDLFAILGDVKDFSSKVPKAAMSEVLPHLAELVSLAEKAGGAEKLMRLLQFVV